MSKEFNIDNYQYIENKLTLSEWLQQYKPDPNHLNENARFSGLLFEHQGDEWDFIVKQPNYNQWTLYREDDGQLYIRNGLRVKGRVGYFFGSRMHDGHQTFVVHGVLDENLEHRILH